jgi:heme exporter protein D
MRSLIDFSSWSAALSTLLGLTMVTIVAVGIRLLVMQRVQQRRERQNRQINERLKTLIAAYKTLGGSFTGTLVVDPGHLRDARAHGSSPQVNVEEVGTPERANSERGRRIRDAVEAALSDVILLGTAEHVRLAAQAANDMAAGRKIETAELVESLRNFIREVLDLDAVPPNLVIPRQGPTRTASAGGRGNAANRSGGRAGGGGDQGGSGMAAGGMMGVGVAASRSPQDDANPHRPDTGQA